MRRQFNFSIDHSSSQVAQFGAPVHLHSHLCIYMRAPNVPPNVPQMNIAIQIASDDQLRVAAHWGDARGATTLVGTRTNRVHKAHFNVPRFIDAHQPIADNRYTPVYKHDVHPIVTITCNKHSRSARTPDRRCVRHARALYGLRRRRKDILCFFRELYSFTRQMLRNTSGTSIIFTIIGRNHVAAFRPLYVAMEPAPAGGKNY